VFCAGIPPVLYSKKKELTRTMRLLIAIPVHNEQQYVLDVLEQVKRYHDQILVIDDGSTDATPRLLQQIQGLNVLRHETNCGYGASLIDAFHWADRNGYDWVITMDCDRQHEPQRIPDFMREIQTDRWDIISGSRYMKIDETDDMPPLDRRTINATLTCIINDMFGCELTDSFCGFKAHRVKPTLSLKINERGYAFPMQFWPRALAAKLRITELPVRLIYNDPNRQFGGGLDDPSERLNQYLELLTEEAKAIPGLKPPKAY
jgi:glycosyltransferase involved in cell wall biosynthesis